MTVQISGEELSDMEVMDICMSLESNLLQFLSLRSCKLFGKQFQNLCLAIGKCKSLLQLNLNLGILDSLQRINCIKMMLNVNRSLTSIFLHGSRLGHQGMALLYKGLQSHPNITSLDAGDCQLTDKAIKFITPLLVNNGAKPGLEELTLSGNKLISQKGWTQLSMALASPHCVLKVLLLDYNNLGDNGGACLAVAIAANVSLETVDLESTNLSEPSGKLFLHLLEDLEVHSTKLKSLNLNSNKIKAKTLQKIKKALQTQEDSQDVSNDDDTIKEDDSVSVSGVLPSITSTSSCSSETSSSISDSDSTGSHPSVPKTSENGSETNTETASDSNDTETASDSNDTETASDSNATEDDASDSNTTDNSHDSGSTLTGLHVREVDKRETSRTQKQETVDGDMTEITIDEDSMRVLTFKSPRQPKQTTEASILRGQYMQLLEEEDMKIF